MNARVRVAASLATLAALAFGCSTSAGSAAADAGDDADAGPCLLCNAGDAAPAWQDPTLPLGKRAISMLHDCSGAEACHTTGSGGLFILDGKELDQLVDAKSTERPELFRVARGDPANSYLYLKFRGDGGITGSRMPSGGAYDPRRVDLAWAWIEAGAPGP